MSTPTLFSYLSPDVAASICKLAAEDSKAKRVARTAVTGMMGLGLGTLAGGAAFQGARYGYEKSMGKLLPQTPFAAVAPVLGGAAGLAYSLYKAHELEEIRRALESTDDKPGGSSGRG